jgi:general stress protein 26
MEDTREEAINKINSLIKDIQIAMLTTNDDGVLRSRPMQTQEFDFDGDLWFFTNSQTHKAEEIEKDNRVNVSFTKPDENIFVSLSGTAQIVEDQEKIKELWSVLYEAWFPKGLEDPNLALLKISVEHAEYWQATASSVLEVYGILKSMMTGKRTNDSNHEAVVL